jgi:hypothetical protein
MVFMDYRSVAVCVVTTMLCYLRLETTLRRTQKREVLFRPAPNYCSVLVGWDGVKMTGLIHRSKEINDQVQEF